MNSMKILKKILNNRFIVKEIIIIHLWTYYELIDFLKEFRL